MIVSKCGAGGKINYTDKVSSEVVLRIVDEERLMLTTICRRKAIWIGHNLEKKTVYSMM